MSSYNILFRSDLVEYSHGNGHPLLVVLGVRHTAEHEPGNICPGNTATPTNNLQTSVCHSVITCLQLNLIHGSPPPL